MNSSPPTAVGVFNTSPDTVEMLRIVLEREGLIVVSAYTYDLRDSKIDIEALVRQHQPKVIIFDIAPPYDANWRLFEHMRAMPVLAGIKFVVTTTNVARVREVAGTTEPLLEIVGKPYDLNKIVEAVKHCLSAS
jgi:CheY-like chemotaxis protein